jgi:hypothetical protein
LANFGAWVLACLFFSRTLYAISKIDIYRNLNRDRPTPRGFAGML